MLIDWRTDGKDCSALSVFDSIEKEYKTTCGKPAPDAEMARTVRRVRYRLMDWFGSYREEIRAALSPAKGAEWVAVGERLPEVDGEYLVCVDPILGEPFVQIAHFYKPTHPDLNGWSVAPIKHWQPLPKPPKA